MEDEFSNIDETHEHCNDNIRQPDSIKLDRLLDESSTILTEEQEISMAILASIQDCQIYQKQQDDFETNIVEKYNVTRIEREKQFQPFCNTLKKLVKYDKKIEEIFEIVNAIIESYCLGIFEHFEIDDITYEKIFKELGSVRIDKNALELLKTIVQKNNSIQ
jgi:hypothetical protein